MWYVGALSLIWIAGVRDEQYRPWRPARPGRCNPTYPKLDLHFPKVDKAELSEFKQVRQALLDEEKGRSAAKK